mmetsp:Transcript_50624/g.88009  ORF Transcript_50624/g.88009 Transcript_50624/m.88009 type:complete len:158 (-) Transcript_50624:28-501(-)
MRDDAYVMNEHLRKKREYLHMVKHLFAIMQKDSAGNVSAEEFCSHIHDTQMVAFCSKLEVEMSDLEQFFIALSGNGKHSVDLDTFVVGCIKLRGQAKSVDMMEVLITLRRSQRETLSFRYSVEKQLREMHSALCARSPSRRQSKTFSPDRQTVQFAL